ncbi:unnamed protein product [Closterium sp. Yama58-4]|nr:unnamed protein product [Closterium sp. Yama58-4]
MLQDIPVAQREDAVASLEYEAQARLRDPFHNPSFPSILPVFLCCSASASLPTSFPPLQDIPDIPVAQREDAVASLEYEAQARLRDPVYGCVGVICLLQKEMVALQEQLRDIEATSLSSSPNAAHGSMISGNGAIYLFSFHHLYPPPLPFFRWVPSSKYPQYQNDCPYITDNFNCIKNGRPDGDFQHLIWKPNGCDLTIFNPKSFAARFVGQSVAIAGDSTGQYLYQSLRCRISQHYTTEDWDPKLAGWTGQGFKVKLLGTRVILVDTPFLMEAWPDVEGESKASHLWHVQLGTINHKILEMLPKIPQLKALILVASNYFLPQPATTTTSVNNSAYSSYISNQRIYYSQGKPISPQPTPQDALSTALKAVSGYFDKNFQLVRPFFLTMPPSHNPNMFRYAATTCGLFASPLQADAMRYAEARSDATGWTAVQRQALSKSKIKLLDILQMSMYRADGHMAAPRKTMLVGQPRLSPHIVLSLDAPPPSRPPCPRRHHHSHRFLAQAVGPHSDAPSTTPRPATFSVSRVPATPTILTCTPTFLLPARAPTPNQRGILFPPRARSSRLPRGILLPPRACICCLPGGLLSPSLACGTRLYSARACCLPAWPPLSIPRVLLDYSNSREPLALARASLASMRGLLSPPRSSSSRRLTRASLASPRVHLSPPRACFSLHPARAPLASPRSILSPPRTCDTRLPSRAPLSSPPMLAPLPSPRMLLSPHLPTCATLCSPCVLLSPPRTCFPLLTLRASLASPRVLLTPHPACSSRLPASAPLSSPCVLLSPQRTCSSLLTKGRPQASPRVLLSPPRA